MTELLERPELLAGLLAGMQDGLSVLDAAGRHVYVNEALCKMLGFSAEELLGTVPPFAYWPREELDIIQAAFARTLKGNSGSFELVFQRKDGQRVEVIVSPAELRDAAGKCVGYFATVKDISERKQLERSLRDSERRWRSIVENPFDFVVLIDRQYRYTFVNHVAPGLMEDALIGKATPFDFVEPGQHAKMRAALDTAFETGRATSYEVYVPQLDAWYASVVGPLFEDGQVVGLSILTRETTEQKRAEEALRKSHQRLAEAHRIEMVGTLAGGVAHDINNLLTPILAHTELAQLELLAGHPAHADLSAIASAAERAGELVRRILLFSRRQEPKKSVFDLRAAIVEDTALLRPSVPANVWLATELPPDPVLVEADRVQIGQVLTNLVTNAFYAMQGVGGAVTVNLRGPTPDDPQALLTVADSGVGMDDATAMRAFEPFFTTKPVGSGTGLGLSIVHSVVREHGGDIAVESKAGSGSTFSVHLPVAQARDAPVTRSPSEHLPRAVQPLRILVVDDEPTVLEVVRAALARAGHRATVASSGRRALKLFAQNREGFDLVLTDQSMPEMHGTELVAALRAERPRLPCLVMTGYESDALRTMLDSRDVFEVIAKPFSLSALLNTVERATRGP